MKDKLWRGWLKVQPLNPDSTIARHMNWTVGGRFGYATSSYPEPTNITAAAAWTQIKQENIPDNAIVYQDPRTGLWIVAVDIRHVPVSECEEWSMQQARNGAIAFWINDKPCPIRPQIPPELLNNIDAENPLERRGRKKGVTQPQSCKPIITPKGAFISKKEAHLAHHMTIITLNKMMMREPDKYYHISMEEYRNMINNNDTQVS